MNSPKHFWKSNKKCKQTFFFFFWLFQSLFMKPLFCQKLGFRFFSFILTIRLQLVFEIFLTSLCGQVANHLALNFERLFQANLLNKNNLLISENRKHSLADFCPADQQDASQTLAFYNFYWFFFESKTFRAMHHLKLFIRNDF